VARVAHAFPRDATVDPDPLFEMVETNLRELDAGAEGTERVTHALEDVRPMLRAARIAELDARMLPHEWIAPDAGASTAVKVDALDHHGDHFFPGPQHPAWDLAAAVVEFDGSREWTDVLLRAFESSGGDREARRLLPFYTLAYAAFRAGYATLSGLDRARARYSQCALKLAACFTASAKSPRKQMARSSMNT
jgi:hypothetical protein